MSINHGDLLNSVIDLEKIALVELGINNQEKNYTYGQIVDMSNAVANALNKLGYGSGDRIGICALNSAKFMCAYYGILKTGATAVLINVNASPSQIEHIISDSQTQFIFTDRIIDVDIPTVNFESTFDNFLVSGPFKSYPTQASDTALILYTSGSSGMPKGVLITHQARNLRITSMKLRNNSVVQISATPCYHNNGLSIVEICLVSQIKLVLLQKFDSRLFLKAVQTHQVTNIIALPTMMNLVLNESKTIPELNLSQVKQVTMSSEPVTQLLYNSVKQLFPNALIKIGYGSTEGGGAMFGTHPNLPTPPLSVGYPLPEISYRIVDGVLQIKSPYMMKQYTVASNVFTDDGYYITNDLFEVDKNGFYYCQGRADNVFKSGGNKISPAELEQVISGYIDVEQVVVVGVEDNVKGFKPYAFVVINKNSMVTEHDLVKYCSQHLTPYQIPRRIWLVDSLPTNSAGKIDRASLKTQAKQLLQQ